MGTTRTILLALLLVTATAGDAGGTPIFASPPHVVSDGDGARIVLFLNEPVSGALASRSGDGFEVRVPRSEVAPAIQGQDFGADGWGNGGDAVKHLVLAAGEKGDTNIRLQPSGAVHGVDAHSVDDPPRLVIELLSAAPTKTPAPTRTPKPNATGAAAARSAAPQASISKAAAATATARPPRATATPGRRAQPAPTATAEPAAHEPIAVAAVPDAVLTNDSASHREAEREPPSAEALARATVLTALAPRAAEAAGKEHAAAAASPAPRPSAGLHAPTVGEALEVAPATATNGAVHHAEPHAAPHEKMPTAAAAEEHGASATAGGVTQPETRGGSKPSTRDRPPAIASSAAATATATSGREPTAARTGAAPQAGAAPGGQAASAVSGPTAAEAGALGSETVAAASGSAASTAASSFGLRCLWRRFGGVAICVADPKAAPYAGDHTITALVGALARGKLPEPEDTPAVATPASVYLAADVLFATRAPEGKLLPVVDAYRSALRRHPDFPEAWRARLNVALAYRAMEFLTEVRTVAGEAAVDPTAGLVRGLAGDLAFVTGKTSVAVAEYGRANDLGGLGACLAARGRARLALAEANAATAAAEVAALGSLCPPELATDPETIWVRGRLALSQGDVAAAKTLLDEALKGLGPVDQGGVLLDLGATAEAAHDPKGARERYDRLVGGAFGGRAARQATVRLAILDGAGGDVSSGLKRLERLTPEASDAARRALVMQSVRSALARGATGEALAMLHEAHVDATALPLEDQVVVAEAYRGIGLRGEAERVLAAAQTSAGAAAPDDLFAARGTLALDRRDGASAMAVADEWIRARGRNGGALALRARGLALAGDANAAHAAVAAAIIEDGALTRTLSLDVAQTLRTQAPAVAFALARQALEPGATVELAPERHAAGLALVGALAEDAGDDDTALAAFTTLAARYGKEPIAADAAYRAARIAARRLPGGDAAAFDEAAKSKDPLARRMAGAAREYEAIVKPLGSGREEP